MGAAKRLHTALMPGTMVPGDVRAAFAPHAVARPGVNREPPPDTTGVAAAACPFCGAGVGHRGTCPRSIPCPDCRARPGSACRRPSGHPAPMHAARWRATERADALACPGFEPLVTPHGVGCARCSGLPEDHPAASAAETPPSKPGETFRGQPADDGQPARPPPPRAKRPGRAAGKPRARRDTSPGQRLLFEEDD